MSATMIVCDGCARHVRASERACPFCHAPQAAAACSPARATLAVALTVAAGMSLAACYGGPPRPRTYTSAQHRPGGATMQVAADPQDAQKP